MLKQVLISNDNLHIAAFLKDLIIQHLHDRHINVTLRNSDGRTYIMAIDA
jgi:hypothetical protein